MFTGSLAMLHRALRLDARLARTHLFRLGFVLLVYFSFISANLTALTFGAPGLRLFELLVSLNFGLITLAGISFFATAITEEKEEETLGLLKMAGMNPLGILLGKSTSRLVGSLLLLTVQFPFTLLAITLGGVTLQQIMAAYCSLAAYLVLLANIGLFCSVSLRRGGNASAVTLLLVVLYLTAGWLTTGLETGLTNGGMIARGGAIDRFLEGAAEWWSDASVLSRLQEVRTTGFGERAIGFQVVSNVFLSVGFFLASWASFNFFTRPIRQTNALTLAWLPRPRRKAAGGHGRPRAHALLWKEFHFVTGGAPGLAARFVSYGLLTGLILWSSERYYNFPLHDAAAYVVVAMLGAMLVEGCIYASRIFHDEWRDRTLPLLMMLPISTPRIVYSKLAGCVPAFVPAAIWLVVGLAIWPKGPEMALKTIFFPSHWFFGLIFMLFVTLTAFFSLVVRWGSLPLALAVMLVGGAFAGCCMSPVMVVVSSFGEHSAGTEAAALCVDAVVALLIAGLQFDIHRRLEITAGQ